MIKFIVPVCDEKLAQLSAGYQIYKRSRYLISNPERF